MWRLAVYALFVSACVASTPQVASPVVSSSELDEVQPTPQPVDLGSQPSSAGPGAITPTTPTTAATPPSSPFGSPHSPPDKPLVMGLLDGDVAVEEAWERWRAGATTTFEAVFEIAVLANRGRPVMMSDELMVIALARAVELSSCDPERLGKIRLLAIAVRGSDHPLELDPELTRLADMGPVECTKMAR